MSVQKQQNQQQKKFPSFLKKGPSKSIRRNRPVIPFMLTFLIMFSVWVLLSGRFDFFHITLGVLSCSIVSLYSWRFLFPSPDLKELPKLWFRFIRYIPWLLYQVLVANVHVMYLALHPNMMELIDPKIIIFRSRLKSDMALVTLANSITLTPGTITVYITTFGDVAFHVIDVESGKSLPWIMDARIAEIFGE